MGLRSRIMLLVALGLLIATAPLAVMGLGMVRTATNGILQERLAMARATAEHLSDRLAQGWWQLNQLSVRVAAASRRGDLRRIRQDVADLAPQMSLFSGGVFVMDRSGRLVAQAPQPARPLPPLTGLPALQMVLSAGRPELETVVHGPGSPSLAIFAIPVFRTPAEVTGLVGGVIDLNKPTLLTFINGLAIGTSGHAVIVSRDGTVLASTETAQLFTRDEHPEFFRALIEGGRAVVGPTGEVDGGGRHEAHVMAFAPLAAVPWGVGIGQSEGEAFGPIRRLQDRIIVFEVVVLLAALLFAWLDTSAVVAPLRVLQGAAERIAEGNLAHPIEVRRPDEIGTLARSLETMRARLLQSLQENARLQQRLQSVAMLEERERIAREMHDSVGQVLGYVNTKAQAVQSLLHAGRIPEAQTQLGQLEQTARGLYVDLREAILNLRVATSSDRRLLPALAEYVQRFTELSGIETHLRVESDVSRYEFSPPAEAHLLRIIQEALTNVRKHASAHRATVQFAIRNGVRIVTVEDDGVGIEARQPRSAAGGGFGLQTMQERSKAIGGTLAVRPRAGGGTQVEITIPAEEAAEHAGAAGG